ncbi:hypothetical protein EYF80_050351 [Liparis tanakae]|uniref:Uncharacterized protein n=1 Tax=Liparis tanakae TaxID=230148 RepID=A0A4Z2FGH1_9TELE|nr:hypothetical protein EYF80_050351 [Liparis tanakae]
MSDSLSSCRDSLCSALQSCSVATLSTVSSITSFRCEMSLDRGAVVHLCAGLQRPQCDLVGTRGERPEGGGQILHTVHQSAVYVDVEARRAALQAGGVQHHVVFSAVRQGGVFETRRDEPAVGPLVADAATVSTSCCSTRNRAAARAHAPIVRLQAEARISSAELRRKGVKGVESPHTSHGLTVYFNPE